MSIFIGSLQVRISGLKIVKEDGRPTAWPGG
jgi:hypothetical protein